MSRFNVHMYLLEYEEGPRITRKMLREILPESIFDARSRIVITMDASDADGATSLVPAGSRPYRMRKRREDIEQTRKRIVDAAVELHGTVGPSRTTFSAIAELAGVQRSTVYRHFADEEALFGACSSQWFARHPWPAVDALVALEEPVARLEVGLRELYRYYDANRAMLGNVYRDLDSMPPFVEELMRSQMTATHETLLAPWPAESNRAQLGTATLLALDFRAWLALDETGLDADEAARMMAGMVSAVA